MTLGSLFDGSGTAPLAARMCGIEPIWCSEIEPFPIAVTRARFPDMKHYGNICDIKGDKIEPVDIICGGSPCQDLSVAGKRAGLEGGERSVLFHEQIRIIKEMRHADKLRVANASGTDMGRGSAANIEESITQHGLCSSSNIRPRFAIWENVPGAYSSNKGEDFRCVLEAFCKIADETADIPRPAEGRWAAAGCIVGNGWSVAYRTLDAQYFGVPQRRRRIFLVADFGSECAAEILSFEGGLFGNIAESGETGESAAGKIEGGVGEASGGDYGGGSKNIAVDVAGVDCRNGAECDAAEISLETYHCTTIDGVASTLKSRDWKDPQCVTQRDIVRRLTPKECQRLQGFMDGWCDNISIPNPTESDISFWQSVWDTYQSINGKKPKSVKQIVTWLKHPHSDSAEYKMWGNGMALPCVLYIMRGIISAERPIICN